MGWVKLDDNFFRNPKVLEISAESKLLYLAGLCYAGASLTDGFVPKNAVKSLAADADISAGTRRAQELVDAGLWDENPRGYSIHDYLEHNSSAADVRSKRDQARERMQRHRSREQNANTKRTSREVREPETDTETDTDTEKGEANASPRADAPEPKPAHNCTHLDGVQALRFERWYQHYPRKKSRGAAEKAWKAIKPAPSDVLVDKMIAKTLAWSASYEWTKDGGQYVPNPSTWLNAKGWDDEDPKPEAEKPANVRPFQSSGAGRRGFSSDDLIAMSRGEKR